MLQIHIVLCIWKSLETVFLIVFDNRKIGRQMAIENLFRTIFDLRSSIVLTFSIAGYPMLNFSKYLQFIFIASDRMTNEPQHVISNNVAF